MSSIDFSNLTTADGYGILVPNDLLKLQTFTIEFEIYISSKNSNTVEILGMTPTTGYQFILQSGYLEDIINNSAHSDGTILTGTFYQMALVFNNKNFNLYQNGVAKSNTSFTTMTFDSTGLTIGGIIGGIPYYGLLSEFRLWNFAKTVAQITAQMGSRLTGNETGLLLYLPLNSLPIVDKSVNNIPITVNSKLAVSSITPFVEATPFSVNSDTRRSTCTNIAVNADTSRELTAIIPVSVKSDTHRSTCSAVAVNSDSRRITCSAITVKADTKRLLESSTPFAVNCDTCRALGNLIPFIVNADTLRQTCSPFTINSDTNRQLAQTITADFANTGIGIKSISFSTGVQPLSDKFQIDTVGAPFSGISNFEGEVAGFSFSYATAITKKTTNAQGTTYSVGTIPETTKLVSSGIFATYGATEFYPNGGWVLNRSAIQICADIGIVANITDFHPLGLGTYNSKTKIFTINETLQSLLGKLFSWSSIFGSRRIYYGYRNGNFFVNEVGRYTTVYDLDDATKYQIDSVTSQEQAYIQYMAYSSQNKTPTTTASNLTVTPNNANQPFSGTTTFGNSSLTYADGLLTNETTTNGTTDYIYTSTDEYSFVSNNNVLNTKITLSADGTKRSTTTYVYDIALKGLSYSAGVDVSLVSEHVLNEVNTSGSWSTDTEHITYHVPLGNGFFGQRVEEINNGENTTVSTSISRGTPGGLASLYTISQLNGYTSTADNPTPMTDFNGELITGFSIPVADPNILNGLADKMNAMNNTTQETLNLSLILLPGASLVDAVDGAITYGSNLYYIQSTNATVNANGTRQQVTAMRWF